MILIIHRKSEENHPNHIDIALSIRFDVEIDVEGERHDEPQYKVIYS